ncbi:uncharacterized protein [Polyergus mexicanus]|uniref:uncharacterized protein isoform X7 n=1 Tax=Polyergus mexicanus TaxID=615972 RepID=UPI0038B47274
MFHRKLRQMHADSSREMISIEDRYFSLNRVLLLIVGLWPYQKSKLARLQFICFFSILITFIIFQLTTFITLKCTANFIIKVLSLAFGFICITIKYYSFFINSETVRDLMEQFQRIYNNLEDINEIAIIEKYGRNARYYTATLTILFVCSIFVPMSALIWPDILQIISSTNTSRPRQLQVSSEYFVDQEKYFYYLLLHINAAACIGLTSAVATGTMLIAYLQYICGMFTIASYRVQNAIKIQISQDIIVRNKKLAHSRIKSAVDIHRKAMDDDVKPEYVSTPPDIQKLLLILIQRGNKTFGLNIGGLFIASIQCFAKLANASLSYFTVMYSVRQ